MKTYLKLLITAVLITLLCAALAVNAGAEEADDVSNVSTTVSDETVTDTDENLFASAYNELTEYAGEILCALTFIGSLILAVAYKKGLLPLIEKSLISIGNAVSKIKDSTKESADKSSAASESIERKLTSTTEALDSLSERVAALSAALESSMENDNEAKRTKKQLRLVMDAQIQMLYDIFMSSALPQYQKDAVGERIAKMKEAIAENDD